MNSKSFSKITAVTSGLLIGLFLNLILSGGIDSWSFAIKLLDLVKSVLMVIAVVGGVAWTMHLLFLRPVKEHESDNDL